MTRLSLRARTFRLVAASVAALVVAIPGLLGVTLNAQTVTEVWQVVFDPDDSTAQRAHRSRRPSRPNPGSSLPSGVDFVPATYERQTRPLGQHPGGRQLQQPGPPFNPGTGAETLTIGTTASNEFYNPQDVIVERPAILVTDGVAATASRCSTRTARRSSVLSVVHESGDGPVRDIRVAVGRGDDGGDDARGRAPPVAAGGLRSSTVTSRAAPWLARRATWPCSTRASRRCSCWGRPTRPATAC